ncbi:hypothetical protein GCM10020358_71790 [Amorphoplanes nipponensis]|uniref:STAS domain-containing protein n=1 Tax=Actinoplanes nipponensis TaxID=135950 RepID=A0A919JC02_9ACTN|nr:STAS domain-containing protein [Actinoplanes nipponensis]GIE47033.1 hypothetical protein Ani05nite_05670 [Actinoplanes nipponensis]
MTKGSIMAGTAVEMVTTPDGTLVIRPYGVLDSGHAVELRHALVHAVRHLRPLRLVLDMRNVDDLDAINVGTLAAACHLGDDHQVAVFVDNSSVAVAGRLTAAGVAHHRLRHVGASRAA